MRQAQDISVSAAKPIGMPMSMLACRTWPAALPIRPGKFLQPEGTHFHHQISASVSARRTAQRQSPAQLRVCCGLAHVKTVLVRRVYFTDPGVMTVHTCWWWTHRSRRRSCARRCPWGRRGRRRKRATPAARTLPP